MSDGEIKNDKDDSMSIINDIQKFESSLSSLNGQNSVSFD